MEVTTGHGQSVAASINGACDVSHRPAAALPGWRRRPSRAAGASRHRRSRRAARQQRRVPPFSERRLCRQRRRLRAPALVGGGNARDTEGGGEQGGRQQGRRRHVGGGKGQRQCSFVAHNDTHWNDWRLGAPLRRHPRAGGRGNGRCRGIGRPPYELVQSRVAGTRGCAPVATLQPLRYRNIGRGRVGIRRA